jgi:hypothetical protein
MQGAWVRVACLSVLVVVVLLVQVWVVLRVGRDLFDESLEVEVLKHHSRVTSNEDVIYAEVAARTPAPS